MITVAYGLLFDKHMLHDVQSCGVGFYGGLNFFGQTVKWGVSATTKVMETKF
jgi:hypothetical protein